MSFRSTSLASSSKNLKPPLGQAVIKHGYATLERSVGPDTAKNNAETA